MNKTHHSYCNTSYNFFVSFCTNLNSLRNDFAITLITVYTGIANTIPTIPLNFAPTNITIKISNGCAETLFEKING